LGVTFYEMLTGALPFAASDPMEWIHCHIARLPVPPGEWVTAVPTQLSTIVMKLLAKVPWSTHDTKELVLVSGYSGVGKSSVVNELHKVLFSSRGLFVAGKFDQYKRDIPYAPLAQALQSLVRPPVRPERGRARPVAERLEAGAWL
jgi:serine/threonine protein kinase